MRTQQVIQQDSTLDKLANRYLTVLPLSLSEATWQCPHCGSEVKPVEYQGLLYRNPRCKCVESHEERQNKSVPSSRREQLLYEAGFTLKTQNEKKLTKFNPTPRNLKNGSKALSQVENFCSNAVRSKDNMCLALEGNYGTGKSHLACGAAMRIIYRKPTTGFWADFVRINQEAMENSNIINYYVERMEKCGVLVIDDLDKKSPGKQMLEALKSVLEYRMARYNKVTIITSNQGLAKLHSHWSKNLELADISASITRRLTEELTCNIPLIGDSYEANI